MIRRPSLLGQPQDGFAHQYARGGLGDPRRIQGRRHLDDVQGYNIEDEEPLQGFQEISKLRAPVLGVADQLLAARIDDQVERFQRDLADLQLGRIEDDLRGLHQRQQAVLDETVRLDDHQTGRQRDDRQRNEHGYRAGSR
jgi:hypothetical protein